MSKDDSISLKTELNSLFKRWASISKIHGLDHLASSRHFILKLIWLVCFLAAMTICAYSEYETIKKFMGFDVTTKIRERYENEITFPAISICNFNPMPTNAANNYIRAYYKHNYKGVNINNYVEFYELVANNTIHDDNAYIQYSTYDVEFNSALRRSFGYNFITTCSFNNVKCTLEDDFVEYYDAVYGNCLRFNGDNWDFLSNETSKRKKPLYKTSVQDSGFSFSMFLGYTNISDLVNSPNKGMIITVNDQNDYHLMNNGIGVKPSTMAYMVLTKTESSQIPKPYSNCLAQEEINTILSREMKKLGIPYSRENCLYLCRQKQNIDKLGCYDMRLPKILNAKPCHTQIKYNELTKMLFDFSQCSTMCPIKCKVSSYDVSTSYLDYPSYQRYYELRNTYYDRFTQMFGTEEISYEMFKESVAGVNIFFDELQILEFSESPKMTEFDFMGSIGGTMGLFLGFSCLVFVEFFELVLDICVIVWNNWRMTQKIRKTQQISQ